MIESHTKNIIALAQVKGIGSAFMKKHLSMILNYKDNTELLLSIGVKIDYVGFSKHLEDASKIIQECLENKINIITIADESYPKLLLEIKDPPPIIYYQGNINNLNKPIAIIGTRKSTVLGERIAARVSEYFSTAYSICNGLAEGVDKASILHSNKMLKNVIGVISGGLIIDKTISKKTANRAKMVLENDGLLLTEWPPFKKEDAFSAIKACRIQAGISKGLILIQSPDSGGSKYTLKTFSELPRPLGAIDFEGNIEYDSAVEFSANRKLLAYQIDALAEMCDIRQKNKIRTKEIFSISGKEDYKKLIDEMNDYDARTIR